MDKGDIEILDTKKIDKFRWHAIALVLCEIVTIHDTLSTNSIFMKSEISILKMEFYFVDNEVRLFEKGDQGRFTFQTQNHIDLAEFKYLYKLISNGFD